MAERVDFRSGQPGTETPLRVFTTPQHAVARGAAAVQRPLPRDAHQRRRRLQPLERPGGHALARGRHAATPGAASATCATPRPARSGRPRRSRRCGAAGQLRGDLQQGRAEFRRRDQDIDTYTEMAVSPEDDIELRRAAADQPQPLAPQHRAHQLRRGRAGAGGGRRRAPGVQQPVRADRGAGAAAAILCTRRPRSAEEQPPWMFHLVAVHGAASRAGVARDRPRALHRPRPRTACAGGDAMTRRRCPARRARCSTRSRRSGG